MHMFFLRKMVADGMAVPRRINKKNVKKAVETISLTSNKQAQLEKHVASVKNQIKKRKPDEDVPLKKGVVYLGHIPHGFFEAQIRDYMGQFGDVLRMRLSRSKRTTRSRGYAFIEFASKDVAKVVAETMNNYLMFEHILKCQYIPQDKVHPQMFKNSWRRMLPNVRPSLVKRQHNSVKSEEAITKSKQRMTKRLSKAKLRLAEMGITFNTNLMLSGQNSGSEDCAPPALLPAKSLRKIETPKHLLEIDSSDEEISFKTPPATLKRKKSKN